MENHSVTTRLLVVSRDSEVLRAVSSAAESNPWQLSSVSSAWEAMEKLQSDLAVDILLIDLSVEEPDGFRCLRWLRQLRAALPILLLDRAKPADAKLDLTRAGSDEYLTAPLAEPRLQAAIARSVPPLRDGPEKDATVNSIGQPEDGLLFVGASAKMHRLTAQVALLAETGLPALILGEPGVGKGTIARLFHQLSARSGCTFLQVDCASLSDELLDREIFGCEAPGGSGQANGTRGKLEQSDGGTLFLDAIEEMPLQLQSKLASVIESGRFIRAGDSHAVEIDVRVVATSSLPIDSAISERRIVPELARRFSGREVRVPPLRERKEELPLLTRYLMHRLSRQLDLAPKEFSIAVEEAWQSYQWPGNLRELRQLVRQILVADETACVMKKIRPCDADGAEQPSRANLLVAQGRQSLLDIGGYKSLRSMIRDAREETERAAIAAALETTGWNRKAAARLLKVSYRSILYKIEQYQMNALDRASVLAPARFSPGKIETSGGERIGSLDVVMPRVAHRAL